MLKVLCKFCDVDKEPSEFYPSLPSKCKACKQKQQAEHRARKKVEMAEYWRSYRKLNKTTVAKAQSNYYARNVERFLQKNHKRRLTIKTATEKYSKLQVLTLTQGTCGLCNTNIDLDLVWPNPWSYSVDHIIPLSKGGTDLLSNVQPTHLTCNVSKGNR
jgi:5-methylcytosine-specific restriction endonuclease McrA